MVCRHRHAIVNPQRYDAYSRSFRKWRRINGISGYRRDLVFHNDMKVFNRWGQPMSVSQHQKIGWDRFALTACYADDAFTLCGDDLNLYG